MLGRGWRGVRAGAWPCCPPHPHSIHVPHQGLTGPPQPRTGLLLQAAAVHQEEAVAGDDGGRQVLQAPGPGAELGHVLGVGAGRLAPHNLQCCGAPALHEGVHLGHPGVLPAQLPRLVQRRL